MMKVSKLWKKIKKGTENIEAMKVSKLWKKIKKGIKS